MKKPQKNHRRTSSLVLLVVLMSSFLYACSPFYISNTVFAPLFDEAGQIKAIGTTGYSGFGFQAGISVTDNVGLVAGISGTRHADEVKGNIAEGGLCYYMKDEKFGKVELQAGFGTGKSEALSGYYFNFNNEYFSSTYYWGKFNRLYIQPSFGYTFEKIELSISSRFSWVNINQIKSTPSSLSIRNPKLNEFFMEPAVTIGFGSQTAKFFFQGGMSVPPSYPKFDFDLLLMEIGVKLSLNTSGKEKNGQINNGQLH